MRISDWSSDVCSSDLLLLEKGEKLPDDGTTLEVEHVIRRATFACHEDWLDRHGPARLQEYANLGGKTKWYGAALLRMEPREFAADPRHSHHGWPIAFEELKPRSEEHTSELQSLMRTTYAVFCLKKKTQKPANN